MERVRRDWLQGGATQVAMRFLERLPFHVVSDLVVFRLDRDARRPVPPPAPDLAFSCAGEPEIEEVVACSSESGPARARQVALFRKFLREGHVCAIVREQGRVVAHQWVFFGTYVITIDGYRRTAFPVALGETAAFMGNAFVRPEMRGRGTIGHLKRYLFQTIRPDWSVYAWSARLNEPAVIANTSAGFRPIGILRFAGPLGHVRLSLQDPVTRSWTRFDPGVRSLRIVGGEILPVPAP